ncbi:hypothetical protein CEXT_357821 [Caerostris extrusa]|uniref:Uncharacterized protein n=1 Tax=Caerostris extrusa TaxID=172846 RepID=A0AAV4XWJ7_CAEEX|nr:hypothetical protein CEXT_357821 [Caerostris extrusa]
MLANSIVTPLGITLTLHSQVDVVAFSLTFTVGGRAAIPPPVDPVHLLKHQRLVADDHSCRDVGHQFPPFELPTGFRDPRIGSYVALEVDVVAFQDIGVAKFAAQSEIQLRNI